MPNWFDLIIITFLNQFARRSPLFDEIVGSVTQTPLIKVGVLVALLWWSWFKNPDQDKSRQRVLATVMAGFVSLFIGRFLAVALPFRARPMDNHMLSFLLPYPQSTAVLAGWSSFPSDHAILVFTLAAGLLMVSRLIGILALIHAFFIVCVPRVYLGLHYPTDILAGMFIGIGTARLMNTSAIEQFIASAGLKWEQKYPGLFYCFFFLVTYQIATLFDDVRSMGKLSVDILRTAMRVH